GSSKGTRESTLAPHQPRANHHLVSHCFHSPERACQAPIAVFSTLPRVNWKVTKSYFCCWSTLLLTCPGLDECETK
ncbi:unnamed protein product, partial [Oikopleura dioica]